MLTVSFPIWITRTITHVFGRVKIPQQELRSHYPLSSKRKIVVISVFEVLTLSARSTETKSFGSAWYCILWLLKSASAFDTHIWIALLHVFIWKENFPGINFSRSKTWSFFAFSTWITGAREPSFSSRVDTKSYYWASWPYVFKLFSQPGPLAYISNQAILGPRLQHLFINLCFLYTRIFTGI